MYTFKCDGYSSSDKTLVATCVEAPTCESYEFKHLKYPEIHIPNRSTAWHIFFTAEDSDEKKQLKSAVEEYNSYLNKLESVEGFKEFFITHHFCISKKEVAEKWSEQIADEVFSKGQYIFQTDMRIIGDYLFDDSFPVYYSTILFGTELSLPIGKNAEAYPTALGDKRIIWNWTQTGHDFCYYIWELLGEPEYENEEALDDDDAVHYQFDAYDQFRDDAPEPQMVRIFKKLENLGYIDTYTIVPETKDPRWRNYCKWNASLDCALVDMSFLKNKLVMEQINMLLWAQPEELEEKRFFITNKNNKQELSAAPGAFGGHKKLKIYGRLDCPSANRYLQKGQYAKNRVFFPDEETAVKAGYRPCGVCMPEAYKKWKAQNDKEG